LKIIQGKYVGKINPGLNIIPPFITKVKRMDLRSQTFDVPNQRLMTSDKVPLEVDATVVIKVVDPEQAFFEVSNYKLATVSRAQAQLRDQVETMTIEEAIEGRRALGRQLRELLQEDVDPWGIKVEHYHVRDVDPGDAVIASMRAQAAADREKAAAVVEADTHMSKVMQTADREAALAITKEALDFLPIGLPESLWGWQEDQLAEAIVDGEKAKSSSGTQLVKIRERWYINDPSDMALHLREYKGDPLAIDDHDN
jgi:regulator of protease activity HflC (stomatin/prohibitin superfamily)